MDIVNGLPEEDLRFIQRCISEVPVIVIGSGASSAYGVAGMEKLGRYLLENIKPLSDEQEEWLKFKELLEQGIDLESALHEVFLSKRLEEEIVLKTRDLIFPTDIEIREKVALNKLNMPLSSLIKFLNNTANPNIKIVTTNYDRLIEYSLENVGVDYYSGFTGKYLQRFHGDLGKRDRSKPVELLKVHGSLDWYSNPDGEVFSLPDYFHKRSGLNPVMVTPGKNKYQDTHDDPFRSMISRVDTVFTEAKSILIIGFGFNDEHIQPKLMQKMRTSQTPIIIISKSLTPNTKRFIKANNESRILGIEKHLDGSNLVYPNKDDLKVEGNLWELKKILELFI